MRHAFLTAAIVFSIVAATLNKAAVACPFCTAVSQTFSEEFESMDVVVLANVIDIPESDDENATPKATFEIVEVIKGEKWATVGEKIVQTYYGDGNKDRTYLLSATDPPSLMWSSPLGLSDIARAYVKKLPSLPKDPARLEFFQDYLEHEDEMLARDAYDEFAKMPYAGVIALKDKMKHDHLIGWIKNTDVPATRRRLYFTMLGICGKPTDIKMLEAMMESGDRKEKAGLDAMLACYLTLTGEKGLGKVDELFLKNKKAEYADTYSAIMAIRFHGSESDVIERDKLVFSLRHILERPNLADLVIPDLARWEDWDVMPRLVELFINADEKSSWVRVPVINYLRACPLPEAESHITALKKIDPDSVKRAMTFFPFGTDKKKDESKDDESEANDAAAILERPGQLEKAAFQQPLPPSEDDSATTLITAANGPESAAHVDGTKSASTNLVSFAEPAAPDAPELLSAKSDFSPIDESTQKVDKASVVENAKTSAELPEKAIIPNRVANASVPKAPIGTVAWIPNRFLIVSVPLVCAAALLVLFRTVLGLSPLGFSTNRS
ncbi:hypothetical protein ACFL2H_07130 [Planctomycetota bacterium]